MPAAAGSPALEVEDVSVSYGKFVAVESVTFAVQPGECVAVHAEAGVQAEAVDAARDLGADVDHLLGLDRACGTDGGLQVAGAARTLGRLSGLAVGAAVDLTPANTAARQGRRITERIMIAPGTHDARRAAAECTPDARLLDEGLG